MQRILVIPDTQVRPGVDTTHMDWLAQAILEYRPDTVVHLGDHFDLPSLSTHDAPGSKEAEGRRVKPDIDAGNEAWLRFWTPVDKRIKRLIAGHRKRWQPQCHFLMGNHENRLTRAIFRDPKWEGLLSMDALKTPGFQRHDFLKIVTLSGVSFCHYFPHPYSGKPIGGTITNRLAAVGNSFCQGHVQGFSYASKQYPDHVKHGLVCGSFYLHDEHYRPADVQSTEWRGIVILNAVQNGDFDVLPLRMEYLRRKYG